MNKGKKIDNQNHALKLVVKHLKEQLRLDLKQTRSESETNQIKLLRAFRCASWQ